MKPGSLAPQHAQVSPNLPSVGSLARAVYQHCVPPPKPLSLQDSLFAFLTILMLKVSELGSEVAKQSGVIRLKTMPREIFNNVYHASNFHNARKHPRPV